MKSIDVLVALNLKRIITNATICFTVELYFHIGLKQGIITLF